MNGGTTIAGTMVLAHLAGIKVFATGGLGAFIDVASDIYIVISSNVYQGAYTVARKTLWIYLVRLTYCRLFEHPKY